MFFLIEKVQWTLSANLSKTLTFQTNLKTVWSTSVSNVWQKDQSRTRITFVSFMCLARLELGPKKSLTFKTKKMPVEYYWHLFCSPGGGDPWMLESWGSGNHWNHWLSPKSETGTASITVHKPHVSATSYQTMEGESMHVGYVCSRNTKNYWWSCVILE